MRTSTWARRQCRRYGARETPGTSERSNPASGKQPKNILRSHAQLFQLFSLQPNPQRAPQYAAASLSEGVRHTTGTYARLLGTEQRSNCYSAKLHRCTSGVRISWLSMTQRKSATTRAEFRIHVVSTDPHKILQ